MNSNERASRPRVVAVEDEPRILRLVSEVLKASGYDVTPVSNARTALDIITLEQPDLVVLDVLLGDGPSGHDICRRLREFSDVAVIMLTAKATEKDILAGFEAGADDYLTKPFSAKELIARVQAVLRRTQHREEAVTSLFRCGELEINFARRSVLMRGQAVNLTRTEYELLLQLALSPECVLTHADLLVKVWGPEYRDDLDYLRAYVRYLRKKLEADPANPQYIVTSPGVGYMLTCPDSAARVT